MCTKRAITRLVFLSINRYHFFLRKGVIHGCKTRPCVRAVGCILLIFLFTVLFSNYFCSIYLFASNYHFHLLVLFIFINYWFFFLILFILFIRSNTKRTLFYTYFIFLSSKIFSLMILPHKKKIVKLTTVFKKNSTFTNVEKQVSYIWTRQIIRYRATATLRRPQKKQYSATR